MPDPKNDSQPQKWTFNLFGFSGSHIVVHLSPKNYIAGKLRGNPKEWTVGIFGEREERAAVSFADWEVKKAVVFNGTLVIYLHTEEEAK